jgi:hypothetical protein
MENVNLENGKKIPIRVVSGRFSGRVGTAVATPGRVGSDFFDPCTGLADNRQHFDNTHTHLNHACYRVINVTKNVPGWGIASSVPQCHARKKSMEAVGAIPEYSSTY